MTSLPAPLVPSVSASPISLILRVGGAGKYRRLQEAIDDAKPGAIIQIAQGTYLENISITASKSLIIEGGWDQQFISRNPDRKLTVIDGGGTSNVFFIQADSGINIRVTIDGITVQNGKADIGGGIWAAALSANSHLEFNLKNSLVTKNEAFGHGQAGGVSIRAFAASVEATLINNFITLNKSQGFGGGIVIMSGDAGSGNVKLTKNIISENISEKGPGAWDGGGVAVYGSGKDTGLQVSIMNNIFFHNRAGAGGGIYAHSLNEAITKIILKNNILSANSGTSLFSNCGAVAQGEKPGGQIIWELTNNAVAGNDGGINNQVDGVWSNTADGASTDFSSYNDIIWGNGEKQSTTQLVMNIFTGQSGKASLLVSYSNIHSFGGSKEVTINRDNTIDKDPLFEDSAKGNFTLKDSSPCIDLGNPNPIYNDGLRPPAKGTDRNDLGAYGGPSNFDWPILQSISQGLVEY